ncbi:MAG: hypothetical protein JO056_06345 [Alphaproteobacteria bacterium]|uniref:DUF7079 family protein n=1 Tax=Bradyrhizobium sp. TaxID=376 RepID=UPI001EC36793|nr:hypothetical protein [Bradyrhizobium sp.]MBV9570841.1 hypothetical protein [Alphaproteobacteria bacterium]MBV9979091.1 hypothetical protein [Bradyrhizobium sp.]
MRTVNFASDRYLERRVAAWCALADLFLDTELQPDDFDRIAATLHGARFGVAEAERILRNEVAPVFVANGLSVAGEWAGWPDEFVQQRVMAHLASSPVPRAWMKFRARIHAGIYKDAWLEVASRLKNMEHDA